jgi:Na+-translocating ferredoxin:NAD+ oxidoreductase RnfE subunit
MLDLMFPLLRIAKLAKSGFAITSSTNPVILAKNVTLTVIDCCAPPPVRLAAHCVAAASLVVTSFMAPNAFTVGAAAHMISEIYDNC